MHSGRNAEIVTVYASCFGVRLSVKCRAVDALLVSACFPKSAKTPESSQQSTRLDLTLVENRGLFSLMRGQQLLTSRQRLDTALNVLQKEMQMCVAEHACNRVFVHAGAAYWRGTLIVLPGYTHSGKSHMIHALVKAGAIFYTDDYCVFDEFGRVHPLGAPIALRIQGGGRKLVAPDKVGSGPIAPDLVLFAEYREGATWTPQQLSPPQAMLKLIQQSIGVRANPGLVLPVLRNVSLRARSFVGLRGSEASVLQWLSNLLPEREASSFPGFEARSFAQ